MKTNFPERIIEMLRGSSNGLTSKDIAERLGTTAGNISPPTRACDTMRPSC